MPGSVVASCRTPPTLKRKVQVTSELAGGLERRSGYHDGRTALVDRERQISEITAKLLESRPDPLRSKVCNIHSFVVFRMRNLRAILNSDVAHARAWRYRWCPGNGTTYTATVSAVNETGLQDPS